MASPALCTDPKETALQPTLAVALHTALTLQPGPTGQLEINLRFFAAHIATIHGGSLGGVMVAKRSVAAYRASQHA